MIARLLSGTMLMGLAAGIALAPLQAAAQSYQGADGQGGTSGAGGTGSDPGLNDGGAPQQNGQGATGPVAGGSGGSSGGSGGNGGNGGYGGGSGGNGTGLGGGGGGGGGIESAGRGGGGGGVGFGSIGSGGGGGLALTVISDTVLGLGSSSTGGRGAGGGGGGGGVLLDGTATLTNQGMIIGGAGGQAGVNGGGGGGGGGVAMTGAGTIVNEGTVRGGNGGASGYGDPYFQAGGGGIGIAAIGGATVINSGIIDGGYSRDTGGAQAAAISFMGGANRLELRDGSNISGNVISAGGDTLALGGATNSSFNVSQIGSTAQYQGFSFFEKSGASTWTLTGTGAQNWSIAAGSLIGNTASLGGNLTFASGAGTRGVVFDQVGNGIYAGTITGDGSMTKTGTGILTLTGFNDYTGATNVLMGTLTADSGALSMNSAHVIAAGTTLDLNDSIQFIGSLSGAGTVTNSGTGAARLTTGLDNSNATFSGTIKDGAAGTTALWIDGTGITTLTGTNTYTGGTVICFCATLQLGNGGTTGSIVGDVTNGGTLIFNRSNTYTFAGIISDDFTDQGKVVQNGSGKTILSGINTYTGATTVNAGTLSVNGSIAASSLTTVNASGILGGEGTVGNTFINGGALAPGNSIGTLTVQGNLVFTAASSYMVEIDPDKADRTNVTGTANLGGATVNASFAPGTYVTKQYTILHADGGLGGSTFGAQVNTNLPANFSSSLSYDASNAYLNLTLNYTPPVPPDFGDGLNRNQRNVANTLVNFFNSTGGIPLAFGTLTPQGLTQVSGETAAGSQQATFDAMTQFMGVITDPFSAGRGGSGTGATGFAAEDDAFNAYASSGRKRTGAERDAYAMFAKAPPRAPAFEARWNVWAAGFGGSQTTDGNGATGSNTTTSRLGGVAVGADYWFSPTTLAGFALAGGGTNFSVANGGRGRSDLFQAGAFVRHTVGSTYITAAAAYGWQDITTDRTVTVAGIDQLRAQFNANAYSGRVEVGNRWVMPWLSGVGVTPYAAAQVIAFDLPSYAETAIAGGNMFALAYAARTATSTRSELGIRSDKSFAVGDAILTLRGRAAWAHDYTSDRSVAATFQSLPGASFVVNGAAPARNAALTTASAEMTFSSGLSLAASFEGEFSDVTTSYAGKGVVRYVW